MQLDKLCVACFSPTHTSMKIARAIADGTHIARREEIVQNCFPSVRFHFFLNVECRVQQIQ